VLDLNILYDDNMPFASQVFPSLGQAQTFNHQTISDNELRNVNALMLRSTTKINAQRVAQLSQCQYLATATAGYNHLDLDALESANIATYVAAGCNAESVAEYALAGILQALLLRGDIQLSDSYEVLSAFTVGVVGLGQVGRRVQAKFSALGMTVHAYDPPRAEAENQPQWHDLSAILDCDIICLHAPLVKTGTHPTFHLFNEQVLAQLTPRQILLNAGRGEVIDNHALLQLAEQQMAPTLILDVWEHEPIILKPLIKHCLFATPHIAGHSLEGKTRGTFMLYEWLAHQVMLPVVHKMHEFLPDANQQMLCSDECLTIESLSILVGTIYDIAYDHSQFVMNMSQSDCFALLRKQYRDPKFQQGALVRREFDTLQITCTHQPTQLILSALGFNATAL
jgi:erythronate-4-phosphate dehydrogenase